MLWTPAQQKYIVNDHIIGSAVINAGINALLAWLTFRHLIAVPVHGPQSVIGDTIGTAVILPFLVCVIVTPLVRKAVRSGRIAPLTAEPKDIALLRWLPSALVLRALALTIPCLLLLAAPLVVLFGASDMESLTVGTFVAFKAVYAGALAAFVSPLSALYAMATTREVPAVGATVSS